MPRFTHEAMEANRPVVNLIERVAQRKGVKNSHIALAWLLARKPWIVPIPGTTNLHHLDEDLGALAVKFSPEELRELNADASSIVVHGERLRKGLLEMSGREAPPKKPGGIRNPSVLN